MRGQISFDLILTIVIFLVVFYSVFALVNDFDTKNRSNINYLQNFSKFLDIKKDFYSLGFGSNYFDDFNFYLDHNSTFCSITRNGVKYLYSFEDFNGYLNGSFGSKTNCLQIVGVFSE